MMVIPAGKFTMTRKAPYDGRKDDDPEGMEKTVPEHQIDIEKRFAVGVYDVTRDQYAAFVKETHRQTEPGCLVWRGALWINDKQRNWRDPGFEQTGRDPVVCVNWDDARAYVEWINGKVRGARMPTAPSSEGPYRLLSWEEAEYSAGAGAKNPYAWGETATRDKANYGADRCFPCRGEKSGADKWRFTSPVGSFPPNAFGLYDMAGNVWQWTGACVLVTPEGLRSSRVGPHEPCAYAVVRGGSWLSDPEYLQTGEFSFQSSINRNASTGIRVAKNLD